MNSLPATTTTTSFTVSWTGTPGPGATSIASYTIYVSDDGGPFTAFLTNTTPTSTTFTGQLGHTYGFYSVATDNLGTSSRRRPAPRPRPICRPAHQRGHFVAGHDHDHELHRELERDAGPAATSIASYTIYDSDNGGPFTAFLTNTTLTSTTFTGQLGHTYGFYSVATDNLGDVQPTPTGAQATTIAGLPTSAVNSLPATTTSTSFTVSWTGTPGPGATSIASYTIYVSDDGGPFTPFLTNTTLTSATFTGQLGHTYGFYSVATDNLGDVQPTPTGAQATITVAITPTPTPPHTDSDGDHRRASGLSAQAQQEGQAHRQGGPDRLHARLQPAAQFGGRPNYQLDTITTKKVKKHKQTISQPITNFTVSYLAASDEVEIMLGATETFPTGGQLTVLGGATTAAGGTLTGNAVFTISKGGKSIGRREARRWPAPFVDRIFPSACGRQPGALSQLRIRLNCQQKHLATLAMAASTG